MDIFLALVGLDHLKEGTVLILNPKVLQPPGHRPVLLVEGNKAVHQSGDGIVLTDLLVQSLAEGGMVDWGRDVFDVEHETLGIGAIDITSISAAEALLDIALEPENSVQSTGSQLLRRLFRGSGLHEQVSILQFLVAGDGLQLQIWLITTERLFEQLGLRIGAGEINEDPTVILLPEQVIKFFLELGLLGLKLLALLLLQVLTFDGAEGSIDDRKALLNFD